MEVVCKSDYQDIYRVKDGVLLVINKFNCITDEEGNKNFIGYSMRNKRYAKGCQSSLCVLRDDYNDTYRGKTYYAGQVIYEGYPVELVDRHKWNYQIKTTGDALSGDLTEIIMLLYSILGRIVSEDDVCKD